MRFKIVHTGRPRSPCTQIDRFQIIVWVRVTGHDRLLRAARSLLFHTFLMDESRSDSEKMDKMEKCDDYDSPSDLCSVF